MKALEQPWELFRGHASASVLDLELDETCFRGKPDSDGASERELERVREQIENNLLPHVAVHIDRFRKWWAVDHELQARPFDRRSKVADELDRERRQVDRLEHRLDATRLDA